MRALILALTLHSPFVLAVDDDDILECMMKTKIANQLKLVSGFSPGGSLSGILTAEPTVFGAASGALMGGLTSQVIPNPETRAMLAYVRDDYALWKKFAKSWSALGKVLADGGKGLTRTQARVKQGQSREEYIRAMQTAGSPLSSIEMGASYDRQTKLQGELRSIGTALQDHANSEAGKKYQPILEKFGLGAKERKYMKVMFDMGPKYVEQNRKLDFKYLKGIGHMTYGSHPKAKLGKTVGGVAGGLAGAALGTGTEQMLMKALCDFDSLGPNKELAQIFEADASRICYLSNEGSRRLNRLTEEELAGVCKENPHLGEIVAKQLEHELEEREELPDPSSVKSDCSKKTMQLNVDGRIYDFSVKHDGDAYPYVIKGTAAGKITNGPVDFSFRFDPATMSFAMDEQKDNVSEDTVTDVFRNRKGKMRGDAPMDRHAILGEGLNLARTFVTSFILDCGGRSPVEKLGDDGREIRF